MRYALRHAEQITFSEAHVGRGLEARLNEINAAPITDEQMRQARELLQMGESRRQAAMEEYAKKKDAHVDEGI
jgi:hypothetical protein